MKTFCCGTRHCRLRTVKPEKLSAWLQSHLQCNHYSRRGHAEMCITFITRSALWMKTATLEAVFPQQFKYIHYANKLQQDPSSRQFHHPYQPIYTQYCSFNMASRLTKHHFSYWLYTRDSLLFLNIPSSRKTIHSTCRLLRNQMSQRIL